MFSDYIDPVYRPPSEANSLILQVTIGCSWNHCTFCEMYTDPAKKFRVRREDEIEAQLIRVAASGMPVRRVFLADGDAMALSVRRLEGFLQLIRTHLPAVQRVSAYCLPRNLRNKTVADLERLRDLGLQLLYVGCESGDDTVLERVSKGETFETSRQSLDKMRTAGLKRSIMILNGLGGTALSEQHAINSARLMNEAQPDFLSTLVVTFPKGDRRLLEGYGGDFELPDQQGLFREMEIFLEHLELERSVFRSDHASNYLILKGTLNRDKDRLLEQVRAAIRAPEQAGLREEWQRGL